MNRLTVIGLLFVIGCSKGPSKPSGDPPTNPPSASSVVAAKADSPKPDSPKPPQTTSYQGTFQAKRHISTTGKKEGAPSAWEKDDGKRFTGDGQVTLQVGADGAVSGKIQGALGDHELHGGLVGDALRASILPTGNDETQIQNGTLSLTREGDGYQGALSAASGDSLLLREAIVQLKPSNPLRNPTMLSVAVRLSAIRAKIAGAAVACGRKPNDVRLVAVSKFQPESAIREAYAAGQRDFGENYVQELEEKSQALRDLSDLRFHLIGHLQTNKAKSVIGRIGLLESVDSLRIVQALSQRALLRIEEQAPLAQNPWVCTGAQTALSDKPGALPLLIEVNVGGEAQKSGCAPEEVPKILAAIDESPHLRACGLMTVPPFAENAEETRPYFVQLRALRDALGGHARLPELSMGMTIDFEAAIAEGATIVRVGTAIFGERPRREAS